MAAETSGDQVNAGIVPQEARVEDRLGQTDSRNDVHVSPKCFKYLF